ncbi:MAG: PAS domain S-box protein [Chlorobi bacterium]|nr:PAS domain S-box protein [Chlorobiota bacterium]
MQWKNSNKKTEKAPFEVFFEIAPLGLLIFNEKWQITEVNDAFFQFGVTVQGIGEDIKDKIILDTQLFTDLSLSNELKELADGMPFEKELQNIKRNDGKAISVIVKGIPLDEENFEGGLLILEDLKISKPLQQRESADSAGFGEILTNLSDFYFVSDDRGIIKSRNIRGDKFIDIFDSVEDSVFDLSKRIQNAVFESNFKEVIEKRIPVKSTLPFKFNNENLFLETYVFPISDSSGNIKFVVSVFKDVTEEIGKKIKDENEINELKKYQQITASIVGAVFNINFSGEIIYWNDSASRLFGVSKSEIFGKNISRIFPSFNHEFLNEIQNELTASGKWSTELDFVGDDEKNIRFLLNAGLLKHGSNKAIVFLCSDITERYELERELKNSEERYRSIVTNMHEFVCTLNIEGKITYANEKCMESFGYNNKEIFSHSIIDLIDPDYVRENQLAFNDEFINRRTHELPVKTAFGEKLYVLLNLSEIRDLNGNVEYYNAVLTDITLKKEAEKDLLLIKSVFDASSEGIVVGNINSILLANERFAELFGFSSSDEIIGKSFSEFVAEEEYPKLDEYIESLRSELNKKIRTELKGKKKDGTEIFLSLSSSSYEFSGETNIVSLIRDVTKEKETQSVIEESEERFRLITSNISEVMWAAESQNGKIRQTFYTSAIEKITGYSAEDFIANQRLWFKIIHPDDYEEVFKKLKTVYGNSSAKNGQIEFRILRKDGEIVWMENMFNLVRDGNGGIEKIYGTIRDVTFDKKAEEKLIQSAENLKQLNDTKDRFISIISHDLRTPFSSILGFTDILLSEPEMAADKRTEYISFIQESSKNMLSLVNALLDWTRLQTGRINFEPQRTNARYVIDKAIQMLSGATLQKNIQLISEVDYDVYIHCDENLLLQVFNNLISNAIKFTNSGGKIVIAAEPNIDEREIKFSVSDNGVGIKEEHLSKLFRIDTKFTLNGTAGEKGSGLGLSLVSDIVNKHGGKIWVESKFGEGSQFYFTIPIASTKFLLVDSEKREQLLYVKLLKNLMPNYKTEAVNNGKEAFEIIKSSSPALVISEHDMPEMNGIDLVRQMNLSDLKYKPPVIILSRNITPFIADNYKELGVEYIFKKPVDVSVLKSAIEKTLKKAIYN